MLLSICLDARVFDLSRGLDVGQSDVVPDFIAAVHVTGRRGPHTVTVNKFASRAVELDLPALAPGSVALTVTLYARCTAPVAGYRPLGAFAFDATLPARGTMLSRAHDRHAIAELVLTRGADKVATTTATEPFERCAARSIAPFVAPRSTPQSPYRPPRDFAKICARIIADVTRRFRKRAPNMRLPPQFVEHPFHEATSLAGVRLPLGMFFDLPSENATSAAAYNHAVRCTLYTYRCDENTFLGGAARRGLDFLLLARDVARADNDAARATQLEAYIAKLDPSGKYSAAAGRGASLKERRAQFIRICTIALAAAAYFPRALTYVDDAAIESCERSPIGVRWNAAEHDYDLYGTHAGIARAGDCVSMYQRFADTVTHIACGDWRHAPLVERVQHVLRMFLMLGVVGVGVAGATTSAAHGAHTLAGNAFGHVYAIAVPCPAARNMLARAIRKNDVPPDVFGAEDDAQAIASVLLSDSYAASWLIDIVDELPPWCLAHEDVESDNIAAHALALGGQASIGRRVSSHADAFGPRVAMYQVASYAFPVWRGAIAHWHIGTRERDGSFVIGVSVAKLMRCEPDVCLAKAHRRLSPNEARIVREVADVLFVPFGSVPWPPRLDASSPSGVLLRALIDVAKASGLPVLCADADCAPEGTTTTGPFLEQCNATFVISSRAALADVAFRRATQPHAERSCAAVEALQRLTNRANSSAQWTARGVRVAFHSNHEFSLRIMGTNATVATCDALLVS